MIKEKIKATAFISYDSSNSIDDNTKLYYKKVYDHYNERYETVKVIRHSLKAEFTDINGLLDKWEGGGTYMSSGLKLIAGEILARDNSLDMAVFCGDGDNWSEDNERVFNLIDILDQHCKIDYFEFFPSTYTTTMYGKLSDRYEFGDNSVNLYKVTKVNQNIFGNELEDETLKSETKENISVDEFILSKIANISDKLDKIYEIIKPIGTQSVTLNVENINSTDFDEIIKSIKKYPKTRMA